jgi:hypothetical protein
MKITVFRGMRSCGRVNVYGGKFFFSFQLEGTPFDNKIGSSSFLRNVGKHTQDYSASYLKRQ